MKIVTICGAGIGSSGILKVNAEKALAALGLSRVASSQPTSRPCGTSPTTPT